MALIGAGQLIKTTWSLYLSNFKVLIIISAWTLVPSIASILLGFLPESFGGLALILGIAVWVGSIIVYLWIFACLIEVIAKIYNNQKYNLKTVYQGAWSKLPALLWVFILSFLVVFGGTMLLIVPGIIFAVWFAFSRVINVIEGTKGSAALTESKRLVSGKWWSVLWRFVATYFVYMLLLIAAGFVLMYVSTMALGSVAEYASPLIHPQGLISMISTMILEVLATPLFYIITVVLYLELKKFKGQKATQ
jgi:hypothetical protein